MRARARGVVEKSGDIAIVVKLFISHSLAFNKASARFASPP